ncbi:MAG: hypothetical protein AAFP86_12515 [Planctomycetota bacterium]
MGKQTTRAAAAALLPGREGRTGNLFTATVLALAAGAGALSACAPAVVAGTAVLVNDEFADNAQSAIVSDDANTVFRSACSTLSHMTEDLIDVDEELRTIKTYVDGALVVVHVETYDAGETRLRVAARRYLIYSDQVASNVRDGILRDLG